MYFSSGSGDTEMINKNGGRTIVVRRKKVVSSGHHGGAWKVAYADFVTAMMAFFLLMWLLSVTDEETRMGLADYFSPTIPIHHTRGGGDGPFDGDSMFVQDVLSRDETGQEGDPETKDTVDVTDQSLWEIQEDLLSAAASGDAVQADPLLKHIRTRLTDEGLIIEVFDIAGSPLFKVDTAEPNPILDKLLSMIGRVIAKTENAVAVSGHLSSPDISHGRSEPWRLSSERAQLSRGLVVAAGVSGGRVERVTGHSDRSPSYERREDTRNRRIEVILLRDFDT